MPDFETIYPKEACILWLQDAYDAVTKCELWDWLATYEPEADKGFMFGNHPNLTRINAEMKYDGHSGFSYGWCMRVMEAIAKAGGWEKFKESVLKARAEVTTACPCRAARGFRNGWCGVAGGGVPACDH